MHREAEHLGEVAGGLLAAVILPVGVGHEADGGVERQVPRESREFLRVERKHSLEQQDREKAHAAHEVKEEQPDGIALPVHLLVLLYPADPVEDVLARGEDWRKEGPLPLVDFGHESAERLDQCQQHDKKENCFHPFKHVHNLLSD